MKVAIIGAGISGMSCAHEFKLNGIIPTIFEESSCIGETFDFQTAALRFFAYPRFKEPLEILKTVYNISISYQFPIKMMTAHSPNKKVYLTNGNLGYIFKRGLSEDSVENQLAKAVNLPIQFKTRVEINNIINDYDYIIVATGTGIIANRFNLFKPTFDAQARIATISGDFNTNLLCTWWNNAYCKNGYAYLIPYSQEEARLILGVSGIAGNELDCYWNKFLEVENIKYDIKGIKDINHIFGFVEPIKIGKIYFVGGAGGFIDDMLGFGMIKSIMSGVCAARAIINNYDYQTDMIPILAELKKIHEFRTGFNTLDNKTKDLFLAFSHLPPVKILTYNNPFFTYTQLTVFARIYNYFWRKKGR